MSIRRFYSNISEREFEENNLKEKDAFKQLKLKGLDILKDFNGKTYGQIQSENEEYANNLDNQAIRTIVIKNWPDEAFLYTVFLRLNTGSKKLSSQELRQALKPGPFLTFLDDETANSMVIKNMLNNESADPRMKDVELALRFYAFKCFAEKYRGNLKEFLDYTCEVLNENWKKEEIVIRDLFKDLEEAIVSLKNLFKPNTAFSRYNKGQCNGRFNRSIYEVLTYYFSIKEIRLAIMEKKDEFVKRFVELNDDQDFIYAISNTTKDINRVIIRFKKIAEILVEILKDEDGAIEIPKLEFVEGKIKVVKDE